MFQTENTVGVLRYMGYCPNHKMRLSADLPRVEPELLEMEDADPAISGREGFLGKGICAQSNIFKCFSHRFV